MGHINCCLKWSKDLGEVCGPGVLDQVELVLWSAWACLEAQQPKGRAPMGGYWLACEVSSLTLRGEQALIF